MTKHIHKNNIPAWLRGVFGREQEAAPGAYPSLFGGPRVLCVGDGLMAGVGDSQTGLGLGVGDGNGNRGPYQRALFEAGYSARLACQPRTLARTFAADPAWHKLIPGSAFAFVQLGTDDLGKDLRFEEIQTHLSTIYAKIILEGVSVVPCTIPPRTASKDKWMTGVLSDAESQRVFVPAPNKRANAPGPKSDLGKLNNWIRSLEGLPGFPAIVDASDAVSTGRDSGCWKPRATLDGVHWSILDANGIPAVQLRVAQVISKIFSLKPDL